MARTQTWGPVTDYFGEGPEREVWGEDGFEMRRLALCRCVHGKEWPEGDLYEPHGSACEECSKASLAAFHAWLEAL